MERDASPIVSTRFSRMIFAWSNSNSYNHIKEGKNAMFQCRISDFCDRYRTGIGIHDPKSKRMLPRNVKRRDVCL